MSYSYYNDNVKDTEEAVPVKTAKSSSLVSIIPVWGVLPKYTTARNHIA